MKLDSRQARGQGRAPVRTCVACRQAAAQAELLRVALVEGRPVADPRRRRAGRGAYVHPVKACVERALKRGGFARAFRTRLEAQAVEGVEDLLAHDIGSKEQSRRGAAI